MPRTATADRVDRAALEEFLRPRHKAVLVTRRSGAGVQLSPVTCGRDQEGRVVVSTYPQRAKTANARRDPAISLCVLSDDFDGPWVQVDGRAEVLDRSAGREDEDPVGLGQGAVAIVADDHPGRAALAAQSPPRKLASLRVEIRVRLVEQKQAGLVKGAAADRDALPHARRERVDPVVGAPAHTEQLQ